MAKKNPLKDLGRQHPAPEVQAGGIEANDRAYMYDLRRQVRRRKRPKPKHRFREGNLYEGWFDPNSPTYIGRA